MNFVAHIFLTLCLIQLLNLSGMNVFLAFLFGVLIDLDHILKIPEYFKKHGTSYIRGYPFRSTLQEPILLAIIIPFCFYFNNFIPMTFFGAHLFLDYLMEYEKRPLGFLSNYTVTGFIRSFSGAEFAITSAFIFLFINLRFGLF